MKTAKIKIKFDKSAISLILANLFTILFALWQQWNLAELVWIYWTQNLIIGFFNFRRILSLEQFSTENFKINNRPVSPTSSTRRIVAIFFALHYGFFHLVYFIFLYTDTEGFREIFNLGVAACIIVFIINHRFSYLQNLEKDKSGNPNIGTIMMFPYARIIPMHLIILFGGLFVGSSITALVFFLLLKTMADLVMHSIQHNK